MGKSHPYGRSPEGREFPPRPSVILEVGVGVFLKIGSDFFQQTPMINKEQLRQYFTAFLLSLGVGAIFSLYLFLRRGYYDLFILNKVLASASLVLLGIILLIGPISRFYNRFDKWLIYRREIGIFAFLLALTHGIISSSHLNNPLLKQNSLGKSSYLIRSCLQFQ